MSSPFTPCFNIIFFSFFTFFPLVDCVYQKHSSVFFSSLLLFHQKEIKNISQISISYKWRISDTFLAPPNFVYSSLHLKKENTESKCARATIQTITWWNFSLSLQLMIMMEIFFFFFLPFVYVFMEENVRTARN